MPTTTTKALVTTPQLRSSFGVWFGYPLITNVKVNSQFDYSIVKGHQTPTAKTYTQALSTQLQVIDSFSLGTGRVLIANATVNSSFTWDIIHSVLITDLVYNGAFTASKNSNRNLITTLVERSVFAGAVINVRTVNNFVEALSIPPTPPDPITLPHSFTDIGNYGVINFTIFYQGINYLQLNAPEFGDSEAVRRIHVKEYTRGNTLIEFSRSTWGNQKIYEYSFSYLNAAQKNALLGILRNFLGRKIQIFDHNGIMRLGFIITPEADVFEAVPRGYSASFKFQQVD